MDLETEVVEDKNPVDDIRADIEKATQLVEERVERGEPGFQQEEIAARGKTEEVEPEKTEVDDKGERPRGEDGKFLPKEKREPGIEARQQPGAPKTKVDNPPVEGEKTPVEEQEAEGEKPPEEQSEALKPPAGWPAGAKAHWAKLPREVQEASLQREKDAATLAERASVDNRTVQAVRQVLSPYEQMIRAEQRSAGKGYNPLEAIDTLLSTAAILRTGSEQQKLDIAADIVTNYGVPAAALFARYIYESGMQPEDFKRFDAEVGRHIQILKQRGGEPTRTQPREEFHDPRVDDILDHLEQDRNARAQQFMAEGQRQVEEFKQKAEFYEDVRLDMSRLLDAATANEEVLPIEQAYEKAIWANPKTRKVLLQRQAKEEAKKKQAAADAARARGTSIKPGGAARGAVPSDTPPKNYQDDLRADIDAAMEKVSTRRIE